jgi:hypothetical protein
LLARVGLADFALARPETLSGGMRQRAALARTLMEDRPVVLMDEPFSGLDALTRLRLQALAAELLAGRTVLLITHDPLEALRMGDHILIMNGRPATLSTLPDLPGIPAPRPRRSGGADRLPRHPAAAGSDMKGRGAGLLTLAGLLLAWQVGGGARRSAALHPARSVGGGAQPVASYRARCSITPASRRWKSSSGCCWARCWVAAARWRLGYSRRARRWLLPVLIASQAIPVFAIAPLLVLWLGYGMGSKIAMSMLIIYFPVTANFYDGLRHTPARLAGSGARDAARTPALGGAAAYRHSRRVAGAGVRLAGGGGRRAHRRGAG